MNWLTTGYWWRQSCWCKCQSAQGACAEKEAYVVQEEHQVKEAQEVHQLIREHRKYIKFREHRRYIKFMEDGAQISS